MSQFTQGHALLVGIGTYEHMAHANVCITVDDIQALGDVLADATYCGYPASQIHPLRAESATRAGLIAALDNLAVSTNSESTVFLYYGGHGEYGTDGNYYLTTHDSKLDGSKIEAGTGLSEAELIEKLRAIPAKRLVLFFNACHSGEISPNLSVAEPTLGTNPPPAEALDAILSTGEGRIIITACRPQQKSWIGHGQLTIFAQALVDGLRGGGYVANSGGYISAFGLYEHLYATVKENADSLGYRQEPELTVLRGVGPFPVALFRGASSLSTFDTGAPIPADTAAREVNPERSRRLLTKYVSQKTINVAERGVAIDGNAVNSPSVTGDGNIISNFPSTFNQSSQTVHGNQTNIDGDVNTEGGLFNMGNIDMGGGDVIGRDKNVQGDDVAGDKITGDKVMGDKNEGDQVKGDKISVGNISGSKGLAIGSGAQSHYSETTNYGASGEELADIFAPLMKTIEEEASPEQKAEALEKATALKEETTKGNQAEDKKMAKLIEGLIALVPAGVGAVVSAFASPIVSSVVGPATEYVLEKIQGK